jgi:hypothetical protein
MQNLLPICNLIVPGTYNSIQLKAVVTSAAEESAVVAFFDHYAKYSIDVPTLMYAVCVYHRQCTSLMCCC